MSLSLEVKKFINSEHTGEYVNVTLPSELPVRREEVRTVHRDTAAAENAKRRARDLANAKESAKRAAQSAEEALSDAHKDERAADKELRERQSRRSALTPEYDEKNGIAAAAQSLFEKRRAESDRHYAVYSEFEKALRKAKTDSNAAHTAAAGSRAALENAETAHKNAIENEARLHKQLEELRNDSAQTEVLAQKTDRESEESRRAESEKADAVAALNTEAIRLAGEKRALEKQIADVERSLAKLGRDLQKAKNDTAALNQQLEALKTAANGKKGADKDAAAQKVNAAKAKADAAAEAEKAQASEHSALTAENTALHDKLTECERCIAETDEKLRTAKQDYDAAKAKTLAASEESTGRKAALAGKNATLDALAAQLENAKQRIAETEKAESAARSALAAAEVEAARLKTALVAAEERAAEKKTIYNDAKALTDAAEADYNSKRADFDAVDVVVRNADKGVSAAKKAHDTAVERLRTAESRLETAREKLADAIKNSEFADSEAVRLRNSVHVIETRYETAKIHYMESGKGEPLLLLHSAGQSLYTFRRLFYKLAMYYRVIAVDLVGHGYSDRPDFFDYTVDDHAESIARFMDSMGIESAHVLGFSFGAGYALELAHKHPERVGKIVAISPGGVTSEMPLTVRMMESGLFGGIASRMYNLKTVEKLLGECVFDHTVINEHDIAEYFKPVADSASRYAVRRTLAEFDENALIAKLREIESPVLLLWGEDDKWHSVNEIDEYRSSLRSCSCTIIRNAGHLVHEEKPDRIAELVRGFIPAGYED